MPIFLTSFATLPSLGFKLRNFAGFCVCCSSISFSKPLPFQFVTLDLVQEFCYPNLTSHVWLHLDTRVWAWESCAVERVNRKPIHWFNGNSQLYEKGRYLQCLDLLLLLGRCNSRNSHLVYPRDLIIESTSSLFCVIRLAAGCVALNRDGIRGSYIVSAVL
jgi:hypothetical protein